MSRQLSLIDVPFRTRLFSTDFLDNELKDSDKWKKGAGEVDVFRFRIDHLLKDARRHKANEDQLRADFIVHVLDALGWEDCYNTQAPVTIRDAKNAKKADYALYADSAAKKRALVNKKDEK